MLIHLSGAAVGGGPFGFLPPLLFGPVSSPIRHRLSDPQTKSAPLPRGLSIKQDAQVAAPAAPALAARGRGCSFCGTISAPCVCATDEPSTQNCRSPRTGCAIRDEARRSLTGCARKHRFLDSQLQQLTPVSPAGVAWKACSSRYVAFHQATPIATTAGSRCPPYLRVPSFQQVPSDVVERAVRNEGGSR